jgi:hypothetical protein
LTHRHASCSSARWPQYTFTPASWKLFSMPARQLPLNGAATKTISFPALFANQMRTVRVPWRVHRVYRQPDASRAGA